MKCRDCGARWVPVRRGECIACGSDAGPAPADEPCRPMVNYALFGMAPTQVCAVHRLAWGKGGCPNA